MASFTAKVESRTINFKKRNGSLVIKETSRMERNLASEQRGMRIAYTEATLLKVVELEKDVYSSTVATFSMVSSTKDS